MERNIAKNKKSGAFCSAYQNLIVGIETIPM